jgi:hypothetical protein
MPARQPRRITHVDATLMESMARASCTAHILCKMCIYLGMKINNILINEGARIVFLHGYNFFALCTTCVGCTRHAFHQCCINMCYSPWLPSEHLLLTAGHTITHFSRSLQVLDASTGQTNGELDLISNRTAICPSCMRRLPGGKPQSSKLQLNGYHYSSFPGLYF